MSPSKRMSNRSRTETKDSQIIEWSWTHHPGVNNLPPFFAHPTQYATPSYNTLSESIVDTDRRRKDNIDDNDVDHIKSVTRRSELSCSFALKGESNDPGSYYTVSNPDPSWAYYAYSQEWGIDGLTGLGSLPTSGDSLGVSDQIARSIQTMLPGVKPKLSILNSIYELKDFKSLPHLLRRTNTAIAAFKKSIKNVGYGRMALKQLRRVVASHYLNYSFNVQSLIADVYALNKAWATVGKQIKSLLDNEGKIRVRHYAEAYPLFEEETDVIRIVPNEYYTYNGHDLTRVVSTLQSPMFRATMVYQYVFSASQRDNAKAYGYLDALGIQLNPAIIWNAIPWTFVVDWVLGVNRFLDQLKQGNLTPTTNILRYCWSVTAARRITNYVNYCIGGPASSGNVIAITTDQYFYTRRKASPDWTYWFSTSGLNLKEFTYLGALIGSR